MIVQASGSDSLSRYSVQSACSRRMLAGHCVVRGPCNVLSTASRFDGTRNDAEQPVRPHQARHRKRDGAMWNGGQVREAIVIHLLLPADLVQFNHLNVERIGEIGDGRIIERNVSVHADPEADEIDRRLVQQVCIATSRQLCIGLGRDAMHRGKRQPVEDVDVEPIGKASG